MADIDVIEATSEELQAELELLAGAGAVARQMARPRAQMGFALLARSGQQKAGYALLAHTRYRLGAATLEAIELSGLAAGRPEARGALLGAAVAAAQQAGLPFLTVRRPAASFAEYGLAPAAYSARLTLPAMARKQPELAAGPAMDRTQTAKPHNGELRSATAADLEDLAALQAATYAGLPLSPLRTAPDWRWLLDSGATLLVLEDGRGRLIGFARLGSGSAGLLVREAGAADAGAARALLLALVERAGDGVALELAPEHRVARSALHLAGELSLRAPTASEPARLWGVVDLAGGLSALLPELRTRLNDSRYAGWSGRVLLETLSGEAAALAFEAGGASLGRPDLAAAVAVRRLSLGGLVQLLLGYREASDLRASGELICADVDLGLIDTLFPTLTAAD